VSIVLLEYISEGDGGAGSAVESSLSRFLQIDVFDDEKKHLFAVGYLRLAELAGILRGNMKIIYFKFFLILFLFFF
jgi:hypothetical protein